MLKDFSIKTIKVCIIWHLIYMMLLQHNGIPKKHFLIVSLLLFINDSNKIPLSYFLGYIFYCVDILFQCVVQENKSWNVESVVKWYIIIDKVNFEMVKQNILKKLDANALSQDFQAK